jgi:hypothetical protein
MSGALHQDGHDPSNPLHVSIMSQYREVQRKEREQKANDKKPRFRLQPFNEIQLGKAPVYLVKGLIPRIGLVVIYGPPKCGKSFITFDLAMHVALGWEYRGRRVKLSGVCYCAFEGGDGFKARTEAFRQVKLAENVGDAPFYLVTASIALAKEHRGLIEAIKLTAGIPDIGLVVLDTLNRSLAGSENKDEDMGAYIAAAGAIQEAFNCAVVIVHHSGVNPDKPRGHTSLTGAVDAQIVVEKDEAGNVVATVEYMKDGPEGESFASRLAPITVGYYEDGEAITSCAVEPAEPVAPTKRGKKKKSLPRGAEIALRALDEAISEVGQIPPASNHIPPNVKAVSIEQWRGYAYRMGVSTGEDRAQRKAFKAANDALVAEKAAAIWDPWVWRA